MFKVDFLCIVFQTIIYFIHSLKGNLQLSHPIMFYIIFQLKWCFYSVGYFSGYRSDVTDSILCCSVSAFISADTQHFKFTVLTVFLTVCWILKLLIFNVIFSSTIHTAYV